MAHCAWMASCADGTVPASLPADAGDTTEPIPGMPKRTPAPDPSEPGKAIPDNDPWGMAYNDLF
eukprot:1823517-Pyramimonas_sp.AAC.1